MVSALPAVATPSVAASFNAPIEIPVPPPEGQTVPVVNRDRPSTSTHASAPSQVLPVPDGNVPVGNVGDLPRVAVSRNAFSTVSASWNAAQRLDLRYRVVVAANSDQEQSAVQALVPSAFRTSIQGQSLIQVGAFTSRDNAEQTVQLLNQNGLRADIQEIE